MKDQGEIPRGDTPSSLGFITMTTIQQPVQVLILDNTDSVVAHVIGYGSTIAINGASLKEFILKQKIHDLFYRA